MTRQGSFGFDKKLKEFEVLKKTLPAIIGDEAVTHFQSNFPEQGFDGQKWKPRKNDKTPGRAILIKSGRLRRSIKRSFTSFPKTVISTDVPYAKIHNEGGIINHPGGSRTMSFKKGKLSKTRTAKQRLAITAQSRVNIGAYQIRMPKREFIGPSKKLDQKVIKIIGSRLDSLFKN